MARVKLTEEEKKERTRLRNKKWREEHPTYAADYKKTEKYKAYSSEYIKSDYRNNKEKHRERNRKHAREYAQRNTERSKVYRETNKQQIAVMNHNWHQRNKHTQHQRSLLYRKRRVLAQPFWADVEAMNVMYTKRDELSVCWNVELEVDHAVPLVSDVVCGLHCPDNLQLLDKLLNRSKGNRVWVDMP